MLLTPAEFDATEAKINKLNTRAQQRGWTGTVVLSGKLVEVTETAPSGLPVTVQYMDTEIDGDPPRYEGWEFLASVEFDPLVVYGAPGACPVDRNALRPHECDHCRITKPNRKHIYVVRNTETGEQMQVGSTCLKDFLGWDTKPVWISTDVSDYAPDGGFGHTEPTYSVETVLAMAWAVIQEYGYVRTNDYQGEPTKYSVLSALAPRNAHDRIISAAVEPHIPGALKMAAEIREWVLGTTGQNEYLRNLRSICSADFVAFRTFGILVSAPQAWAKDRERTLIRERENAGKLNEWNGAEGDKLDLTVTVIAVRFFSGDYGTTTLYTMLGTDGRTYKWWASRQPFGDTVTDKQFTIRGTVKKLDEYQGHKATVLTRVKVV